MKLVSPGRHLWLLASAALLFGCKGNVETDSSTDSTSSLKDDGTAIEAFYASKPDYFTFASIEDLPSSLIWENGADLPEVGSPKAKKGGTYNDEIPDFPRTLRLIGPDSNGSFRRHLFGPRMSFAHEHPDIRGKYFPGIAKEWSIDWENNKVYIRINPEAKWNDGTPITAEDALYTFYFRLSKHIQAPFSLDFFTTKYENVTRYDSHTFSITVKVAKPDMPSYALEISPTPRHFFGTLNENHVKDFQWKFVPTSGAYLLEEDDIKKGRSITFTRHKNWWAKDLKHWRYRFNPDKIHLRVIRDSAKAIEEFKRGDIDYTGLNLAINWYEKVPNDLPEVKDGYIKKAIFYNDIPRSPLGLWINSAKPNLDNKSIRQGIHYACNFQLVVEKFFRNDWERLNTSSDGYGEMSHPTITARSFSPEKAIKLFAEAGFTKRGRDGILVNDQGERLSFTISNGADSLEDLLAILRQEALKAGLELRLETLDGTTFWKKVQEKKHQIAFFGFGRSSQPYPTFWQTYHSDNANKPQTNNVTNLVNPQLDKLIDTYRNSPDIGEMTKLAHEIEKILEDEAVFVPGAKQTFFRCGFWRWLCFPEDFGVARSSDATEYYLHWIDEDIKKETLAARKSGKSFGPSIKTYDQFKK